MTDLLKKIQDRTAVVCVVGLGYVGLPMVMALVRAGFRVHGVDKDQKKMAAFSRGECYLEHVDPGAIKDCVDTGRAWVWANVVATPPCDVYLVCVPTPVDMNRQPDMRLVDAAMAEIAEVATPGSLVVLESTVAPGATRKAAERFESGVMVAFSPEREDPGNEHYWTHNTPKLVGALDDVALAVACELYEAVCDTVVPVESPEVAETAKLFENTFRMVNVGLVNELKDVCDAIGLDAWDVIKAADTKPFGFKAFWPGPGVGGHCFIPGTLVVTENGPRPIEQVEFGDRVLSGDGNLHKVLGVSKRVYDGDVVTIKSRGAISVTATVGHEIYSSLDGRPPRQGRLHFPARGKKTIDLMGSVGKVAAGALVAKSSYTVWPHINGMDCVVPEHATDEYVELAGWYLSEGNLVLAKNGDGSIRSGRVQISLNAKAKDDVALVERLLPAVVKQVHPMSVTKNGASLGKQDRGTCIVFRHGCTLLAMKILEDFNQRAMTKKIPAWILWGDERRLPIVLRGMFRGDGHSSKLGILSYSTISPDLAFGVSIMLNRLGVLHTMTTNKLRGREHVAYSVVIANGPSTKRLSKLVDFPLKAPPGRGTEQFPMDSDWIYHRVEKLVRHHYRGDVHNLHVDETNNYITPIGVVANYLLPDSHYYQHVALMQGIETRIVNAAFDVNYEAPDRVVGSVSNEVDTGGKVLIIGLAYKRDVGDVRESPAVLIAADLCEQGFEVAVHDPYIRDMEGVVGGMGIVVVDELDKESIRVADAVLVLTDHRKRIPWSVVLDNAKLILDTRGFLDKTRNNVKRI